MKWKPGAHGVKEDHRSPSVLSFFSDSTGMWEEQEGEEGVDDEDDDEDEGLAGQLLSDLIASNKYGTDVVLVIGVRPLSAVAPCMSL